MSEKLAAGLVVLALIGLAGCGDDAADTRPETATQEDAETRDADGGDDDAADTRPETATQEDAETRDGDDGDGATADAIDPCTLLTEPEVEDIAGGPPDSAPDLDEQAAVGMAVCTWTVTMDESTGSQRYVQVAVHQTTRLTEDQQDGGMTAKYVMEQNLAFGDSEEVEGLGHDAWFTVDFGTFVMLNDDLVLNVSATGLFGGVDEAEERDATRRATELALANLEAQLS